MTYTESFWQVGTFQYHSYFMVSQKQAEPLLDVDCPIRQVINIVGDKWTLPVLYVLKQGPKRYSEIQREIPGISKKMLTQTLRQLESDEILQRTVYAVVPPKTEYKLTAFGTKLIQPLQILANWAQVHQAELRLISNRRNQTRRQPNSQKSNNRRNKS